MIPTRVSFDAELHVCWCATTCDHEAELCEVVGLFTPGAPGVWGGPPDGWAQADPDELDVREIWRNGERIDVGVADLDNDTMIELAREEFDALRSEE